MKDRASLEATVFGERTIYDSKWVRLLLVDVKTPDGRRFESHVVRLRSVAVAAVIDEQDRVLMLYRHRFVTNEWGWELPGGIVDAGERPLDTAAKETAEETGWRPRPLRHLLSFQPIPGMVDMPYELFVADGADKVGEPTDEEEAGIVEWKSVADVLALVQRRELLGSGTLVALLYLLAQRAQSSD